MATISFAKAAPKAAEPTKTETPKPETAVATTPKASLPALAVSAPQLAGEFTRTDVATPYLSLGQKTGKLTDEHPEWMGKYVYDKADLLGDQIRVVVAAITKRYEEDLPFGTEEIPRRYDTKAAADAEGVQVRDVADIDLLIEVEGVPAEKATIEVDGKAYAPARYTVRSSAYGAMVKILLKDYSGWLKGNFHNGHYLIGTEKRTGPKGSWFVPRLKPDGQTSDALRAALAGI